MINPAFHRTVVPFTPSAISYLRTLFRCGLAERVASPRIPSAQALLWFSLTYGAGATVEELSRMPVRSLLDANGNPSHEVRFDPSVTKHGTTRGVPMHADIAADLIAFRQLFPNEQWIAFTRPGHSASIREHLPASTITGWFRSCLRQAGLSQFSIASGRKAFLDHQRCAA